MNWLFQILAPVLLILGLVALAGKQSRKAQRQGKSQK